ncbi:DUF885 domain-containing protein [Oceanihabitans sp. 2_MG-2023]|uniref:DUF885 domain-containing protein n=1 Tax=Oceanihabitans sp. 2_MG-2023 TaxID=3062661 RepID=UPI0026E131AC|nr:DUF885 domain-containing protein [Oceanihabitans sp. 2_MG-2023]MDO6597593.1 DUF885 domain-containing protein [Oceanihabitans sp. 2_MG-2023]
MKNILAILCLCVTMTACKKDSETTKTTKTVTTVNTDFKNMLDTYYQDGLKLNPLAATYAGDNRYNDKMPNMLNPAYKEKVLAYYNNYKNILNTYKDQDLNASEKLSKATLNWDIDINLANLKFKKDLMPIDQMWSLNLSFGQLASGSSAQPFETVQDYNHWLKRVDGYLEWLASAESNMKEGMKTGFVLPKSLIIKIIPQMAAMAEEDVESHLFYQPIKNLPEGFSEEDKKKIIAAYTTMVKDKVIPAYQKMHAFVSTSYLEAGRESSGISAIPKGKEYYNHQIKTYTTTNMTADEIHELGLKEVARILSEMEKVKTQVGYEGDIISFFDFVRNNKELMPFTDPQQVLDNFNVIHETMKPKLEELFDVKPKTAFEVRRTEAFREASGSAEYNPGSLDGTRPGIFYTPIPDVTKYNTFSDEALFLHEAIPGHHYQISLQQEDQDLPEFRKTLWYSAYGEGWALYSESLGKELGLYTDPYQYFGMLGMEMHRAIRLVVDTGIHVKGWTREQAIQYSLDNEAESEASITSEIERYMANPGQALSYKIGQLKIRELRAKSEKELGAKFDIKQFHNQVLETGCVPLALLETKIDNWIATNK